MKYKGTLVVVEDCKKVGAWRRKKQSDRKNRMALMLLLANIEIMDFDSSATESYGKIRAHLEKKGTHIDPVELMISGHAKSLGCTLVTNNTNEFQRVEGLKLENWVG